MSRFVRHFSSGRVGFNSARTFINPVSYTVTKPSLDVSSGVLLATQSMLPSVIEQCSRFNQENPNTQLVVAGVDSLTNSKRNGVTELWLTKPLVVSEHRLVDNSVAPLRESDGINIVLAKENWKLTSSSLVLRFGSVETDINLANTLFSTGLSSTLFVLDKGKSYSGEALESVNVEIRRDAAAVISTRDNWTPLYDYAVEAPLVITKCIGNLVKEINGKSASSFLQDNAKLMSIGSKETKVYVKLDKSGAEGEKKRYEVIAGGGGWGAKASTIVLSPEAVPAVGDALEFYMLTPSDRFKTPEITEKPEKRKGKMVGVFECTYEQTTYSSEDTNSVPEILDGVFCAGSESGFKINDVQHFSVGEEVTIQL